MNTDKTKPIDQESKEFIKWSMQALKAETFYTDLTATIVKVLREFYDLENKPELLALLKEKLEAGAREHGKPSTDVSRVNKEIQQEMLDLIGWNMIASWQLKKKYKQ